MNNKTIKKSNSIKYFEQILNEEIRKITIDETSDYECAIYLRGQLFALNKLKEQINYVKIK